jgi:hypothetical protein
MVELQMGETDIEKIGSVDPITDTYFISEQYSAGHVVWTANSTS